MNIDEAANSTAISYAAATTQPRLKKRPPRDIPQSVIDAGVEGSVKIVIDISAEGKVTAGRIVRPLHPDADVACIRSWKKAIFRPAKQGDSPVAVQNFPRRCHFKALN